MKRAFTLIEVLIAMLIVVGSAIFLLKAIMATQNAIIYADHKQKAAFLLNKRIEEIKAIEWATTTPNVKITEENINWQIGGVNMEPIPPIEFYIIPGTITGTGTAIGRPRLEELEIIDRRGIVGGTFTITCFWKEGDRWSTITNTMYIANRSISEESIE